MRSEELSMLTVMLPTNPQGHAKASASDTSSLVCRRGHACSAEAGYVAHSVSNSKILGFL